MDEAFAVIERARRRSLNARDDFDSDDGGARLRVPPHSREAEQSVLGSLMQDREAFGRIADAVGAADFYRHEHRLIFGAVEQLVAAGQPVDPITLFERLEVQGRAEDCGGLPYLNQLAQCVPSAANIARYAEVVRERATLRQVIAQADEIAARAFRGDSAAVLLDEAKIGLGLIEQQRETQRRGVPLVGLEGLQKQAESVRWLVKHVVPAESIGMLYGGSGTFKSFIALDAGLHVAHGLPWMGRRTAQGSVLYIAAEGGSGLWPRIDAWHQARRLSWHRVPLHVVPVAVDLLVDAWRVADAAQAQGVTPALVVVDTLSQTYSGEENSANEMAAYLRELGARFRSLWGCAVLLIHHTGHQATERPRGSSAIRANLDFLLGVHRDEKEMLATLSCVKQKDGDLFEDTTFSLSVHQVGTDEDGDRITSLVARHLSSAEEVQEAAEAEVKAGRSGGLKLFLTLAQNGSKEDDVRRTFYAECGLDEAEARRKAYWRARKAAVMKGLVDIAEGVVITLRKGA